MNLTAERMAFIRRQIESGAQLEQDAVLDLQGHNDHLIQIWEARGRLLLITERERDQLKAENEAIKAQIPGWTKREIELIADCEALRKDAERYRWFRAQHWNSSAICAVADPKMSTKLGAYCPSADLLDSAIDTAISPGMEARL